MSTSTSVTGTAGNDVIITGNAANFINAGAGNDIVASGNGNDTVLGGTGNDIIFAGNGDDSVDGGADNDYIDGGNGNDVLLGGAGNDTIFGGRGNDTINAGAGIDWVDAGSGNDLLIYVLSDHGLRVPGSRYEVYSGASGIDTLRLVLTAQEALLAGVQADLARLRAWLAPPVTRCGRDDDDGRDSDDVFTFTSLNLKIAGIEKLEVTIVGGNTAPVAVADAVSAAEDGATVIAAATLLANDTDADAGDTRTLVSVTNSAAGAAVSINAAGAVVYNPGLAFQSLRQGQVATDSFTYTMRDAAGATSTATVTVTVIGSNDGPVAVADTANTDEDTALTLLATALLANDTDADAGDTKTLVSVTNSAAGAAVSINAAGNVVYTPGTLFQSLKAGATATDSFTYTMQDGAGALSSATVTMTVTGVNDGPQAVDDTGAATEDGGPVILTAATLLANDTDPDAGDTKTLVSVASSAAGAAVSINAAGNVVYDVGTLFQSLKAGATTTDSFTYTMQDGAGALSSATVTMTVTGVNDGPQAVADTGAATEDGGPVILTAATLLANDTDADAGDTKTLVSVASSAAGAAVSINAAGNLVYDVGTLFQSLKAGATATDSFTYTMQDSAGALSSATVTMTVTGVNDGPQAVDDTGAATEDGGPVILTAATLLANDTDADAGDTQALVSVANSAAGAAVSINASGNVVYDIGTLFQSLKASATATDSFTYTMQDGAGALSSATVTMTVTGVNDGPQAVADTARTNEDTAVTILASALLANDTDADAGDTKTLVSVTTSAAGASVIINAAGDVVYDPGALFQGLALGQTATDTFTYTMKDGFGAESTATVTVTIDGADEATVPGTPVGLPDRVIVQDASAATFAASLFLANDSDPQGQTIAFDGITSFSGNLTNVTFAGSTVTVTAASGAGTGSFTYKVRDTDGNLSADILVDVGVFDTSANADRVDLFNQDYTASYIDLGGGDDVAIGSILAGSGGRDRFIGGAGADLLVGNAGNDTLTGGFGANVFEGGAGNDVIQMGDANQVEIMRLSAPADNGTDVLSGLQGIPSGPVAQPPKDLIALLQDGGGWNAVGTTPTSGQLNVLAASDYPLVGANPANFTGAAASTGKVFELIGVQTTSFLTSVTTTNAINAYVVAYNGDTDRAELWWDANWQDSDDRLLVLGFTWNGFLSLRTDEQNAQSMNIAISNLSFAEWAL